MLGVLRDATLWLLLDLHTKAALRPILGSARQHCPHVFEMVIISVRIGVLLVSGQDLFLVV